MLIRTLTLFVALIGIAIPTHAQSPTSPKVEMKSTIDGIVSIVEQLPEDSQKAQRRTKLRELINPKFSFAEMSRRSLGSNWTSLTPEQQGEFTEVFSDLLARTYLSKIETVKRGMVTVDSESIELPKAIVKTMVTSKGDRFPIDYKLMFEEGRWQVYDVVIENIGLVANYRNEFAGIMRKDKFTGLMSRLREKASHGA
jgi:phospholipid transport system substrate-binding protein